MSSRSWGAGALVLGVLAGLGGTPAAATRSAPSRVIVVAGSASQAEAAVRRAGGQVVRRLPLVDGVAAVLPAGAVLAGVQTVTPDEAVRPRGLDSGGSGTVANAYRQETQAGEVGAATRPVTVAVIDTGISPVGGLAGNLLAVPDPQRAGATAACANFSSEATCEDTYGHGTFLAGLIAGHGPYPGMAESARLVSVKIAGRDGSADTSQLLAAIQYVVSFRKELNIKVLNLSLGTDSNHDSRKDPLNRAVEKAWQAGITVVVAASNRGHVAGSTISKPADDPLVLTVGSVDDRGTGTREDDTVPAFTAQGPVRQGTASDPLFVAKPDVVAPGVGLVSLAVAGSHIEQTAPASTVGVTGYRRGSGTSQSAAVVSGAAALLLQRRDWTPDEVKAALVRGARPIAGAPATLVGAGIISVSGALGEKVDGATQPAPRRDPFDGLDASRANVLVASFACSSARLALSPEGCTYVHGDLTARGTQTTGPLGSYPSLLPFQAGEYAGGVWDETVAPSGQSWYSSQWVQGQSWYGQSWYGQSWYEEQAAPEPTEGTSTPFGTVLPGSAWYGVWR